MAKTQTKTPATAHTECAQFVLPVRDTLDLLSGKWKLPILGALMMNKKRFKEIEREIPKLSARMLSKELKEMEINHLITRTVYNTMPVSVEYELTEYGHSLETVLMALRDWGAKHRKKIMAAKK